MDELIKHSLKKKTLMTEERPNNVMKELDIPIKDLVIGIKGAGEMATGVACRLFSANIRHIFMMEVQEPLAVRRTVSFCEAIWDDKTTVEGITAKRARDQYEIPFIWQENEIPVLVDAQWAGIKAVQPHVVIDAVIAKKNLGTKMTEAPLTIGLGPGFTAGDDVHLVIETNRGHNLGRVIAKGPAEPNTGVPGSICGVSTQRVLRAPCSGIFRTDLEIGSLVKKNDVIGDINGTKVYAQIDGMIRGLIRKGFHVSKGLKIGDIDPRGEKALFDCVSEKARAIGGAVLEAILSQYNT